MTSGSISLSMTGSQIGVFTSTFISCDSLAVGNLPMYSKLQISNYSKRKYSVWKVFRLSIWSPPPSGVGLSVVGVIRRWWFGWGGPFLSVRVAYIQNL